MQDSDWSAGEDLGDLSTLSDEVLNLMSVGAAALMGVPVDEGWGDHEGAPIPEDVDYSPECRTCVAAGWFDAIQAEMRRRDPDDGASA